MRTFLIVLIMTLATQAGAYRSKLSIRLLTPTKSSVPRLNSSRFNFMKPQSSGISPASSSRRSSCFSSPITRRPTFAAWRWAASLSFVCRLCLKLASEMRCKPRWVLGPVDRPPYAGRSAHCACMRPSGRHKVCSLMLIDVIVCDWLKNLFQSS